MAGAAEEKKTLDPAACKEREKDSVKDEESSGATAHARASDCPQTQGTERRRRNRGPKGYSQYRGVCITRTGKWRSVIYVQRKQHYLGVFDSEIEAAQAYDRAAIRFFGNAGKLNFPFSHPARPAERDHRGPPLIPAARSMPDPQRVELALQRPGSAPDPRSASVIGAGVPGAARYSAELLASVGAPVLHGGPYGHPYPYVEAYPYVHAVGHRPPFYQDMGAATGMPGLGRTGEQLLHFRGYYAQDMYPGHPSKVFADYHPAMAEEVLYAPVPVGAYEAAARSNPSLANAGAQRQAALASAMLRSHEQALDRRGMVAGPAMHQGYAGGAGQLSSLSLLSSAAASVTARPREREADVTRDHERFASARKRQCVGVGYAGRG